jgi:hypothetical protein
VDLGLRLRSRTDVSGQSKGVGVVIEGVLLAVFAIQAIGILRAF